MPDGEAARSEAQPAAVTASTTLRSRALKTYYMYDALFPRIVAGCLDRARDPSAGNDCQAGQQACSAKTRNRIDISVVRFEG